MKITNDKVRKTHIDHLCMMVLVEHYIENVFDFYIRISNGSYQCYDNNQKKQDLFPKWNISFQSGIKDYGKNNSQ